MRTLQEIGRSIGKEMSAGLVTILALVVVAGLLGLAFLAKRSSERSEEMRIIENVRVLTTEPCRIDGLLMPSQQNCWQGALATYVDGRVAVVTDKCGTKCPEGMMINSSDLAEMAYHNRHALAQFLSIRLSLETGDGEENAKKFYRQFLASREH